MAEANVPNKDVYKEFEMLKPVKSEVGTCESNITEPQLKYLLFRRNGNSCQLF